MRDTQQSTASSHFSLEAKVDRIHAMQAPETHSCDVLVIGGGNAAVCAALMATEAGARVTVLEAAPKLWRASESAMWGRVIRDRKISLE
ncbi:MAG: FAD-dependent oxidoreductase [Betaproteobacteria bacterium]